MPRRKRPGPARGDGSQAPATRPGDDTTNFIEHLKATGELDNKAQRADHYRTLLLAQTPRAVIAQEQMDKHKHGYHNREKRLYELIDFNDTFVSYVLATPHVELAGLAERLWRDMENVCRRSGQRMFTPDQYEAIVRGLSREIAVYRSAKYMGFDVQMTNRTEDAFGIDLVIIQRETGKQLNIDCKTPPAFRHRMEDLVHHGRITEEQLVRADEKDYLTVMQHRNNESVPVTLLCIRPDTLGEIHDFVFDQPERLKKLLDLVFASVASARIRGTGQEQEKVVT